MNDEIGKFGPYQGTGYVYKINPTREFGSNGFRKREFVLCGEGDGKDRNFVKCEVHSDMCDKVGDLREGDLIKVTFFINGVKWLKQGETTPIFFCNNKVVSFEVVKSNVPNDEGEQTSDESVPVDADDDDLPF